MIYRGQGFLAVVRLVQVPRPPSPLSPQLDRRHTGRLRKRANLLTGGGRDGRGAESYDRKKAWSSVIFNSLWCGLRHTQSCPEGLGEGGEVQRHDAVLMVENI
jgi:hypothetical protein